METMKRSSFILEDSSDKVVTIEEELDAVEVGGIESLVDLPRLMFLFTIYMLQKYKQNS